MSPYLLQCLFCSLIGSFVLFNLQNTHILNQCCQYHFIQSNKFVFHEIFEYTKNLINGIIAYFENSLNHTVWLPRKKKRFLVLSAIKQRT